MRETSSHTLRNCISAAFALLTALALIAVMRVDVAASPDVMRIGASVVADQQALDRSVATRAATHASLSRMRSEHNQLLEDVERRLVSIYKAGGAQGVGDIVVHSRSVGHARAAVDVLDAVAQTDQRLLKRHELLSARIATSEDRIQQLDRRIAALQISVRDGKRRLAEAKVRAVREQRSAQLRAAAMARVADVPLTPRAVAPETIAAQVASPTSDPAASHPAPAGGAAGSRTGIASMYSDQLAGRQTASGEPYDPSAMTAAHPSLPLGSWVSVRGPGGSVLVRINDRGPFVAGRIIDLSRAAANAIGLPGLGTVTIAVQ